MSNTLTVSVRRIGLSVSFFLLTSGAEVFSSTDLSIKLTNSGNAPVNISAITAFEGFNENDDCSNLLEVGSSCLVKVQLEPGASGSLVIEGNVENTPSNSTTEGNSTATTPPANNTGVLSAEFYQDFDDIAAGTVLTENQIRDVFSMKSTAHVRNDGSPGVMVVADPANSGRGKVFQVSFPKGSVQTKGGGAQWVTRIAAGDQYYFSYDIYVPAGFSWPLSSKLPGLFGGDLSTVSGGRKGDGVHGFALRQGMISERKEGDTTGWSNIGDGNLGANPHVFGNTYKVRYNYALANTPDENSARLIPGYWTRIEQHVRLNDPGVKNGVYEAWVDGVKVFSASNYEYRTIDKLKIDGISFVWFYGGSGETFAAREDQAYYFDNFVVSTQPISH